MKAAKLTRAELLISFARRLCGASVSCYKLVIGKLRRLAAGGSGTGTCPEGYTEQFRTSQQPYFPSQ
jgi:hypothetical protein